MIVQPEETNNVDVTPVEEVETEKVVEAPVVRPVSILTREPVAIQAVIQAGLGMAMGFGLNMTTEQMGLVLMFTAAMLALITRQQVTPFEASGTNPLVNNKLAKSKKVNKSA